jgi:hypothetical protein
MFRTEKTNSNPAHGAQEASCSHFFPAQLFHPETHTIGRRRGCFVFMLFLFMLFLFYVERRTSEVVGGIEEA